MFMGLSYVYPYYRYALTVQGLPWLTGTFRYTQITNRLYGPRSFSGDQSYKDRSVDVALRLFEEDEFIPETVVGLRDIGGNDLFGAEYIVANKRYFDWDFSLGLGWGQLGTRGHLTNPLATISDRFRTRGPGGSGTLGSSFFGGEKVALFGGVTYRPFDGDVTFKLEYDPNNYLDDPSNDPIEVESPLNFGADYRVLPWLDLSLGFERGNEVMARATIVTNFNDDPGIPKEDPAPQPIMPRARPAVASTPSYVSPRPMVETRWTDDLAVDNLFREASDVGLEIQKVDLDGGMLSITVESFLPLEGEAPLITLAEAAARRFPTKPRRVTITAEEAGRPFMTVAFDADQLAGPAVIANDDVVDVGQPEAAGEIADGDVDDPDFAATIDGVEREGFRLDALDVDGRKATLFVTAARYRNPARIVGRVARIATRTLPPDIERIAVVVMEQGLSVAEVEVMRTDLERAARLHGSAEEIWAHTSIRAPETNIADASHPNPGRYPSYDWSISPKLRQHVGGPDNFYFFQVWLRLGGEVELARGLTVDGALGFNLYNNFEGLKLDSDSVLPHVRSDIKNYLKEGENSIASLQVTYLHQLAPDLYGSIYGGLLEPMFGGVGGEVLYRPFGARWAVGADINWVKQRDYDQLFSFRDYDVVTGHASLYYDLPYYNLDATVRAGRYLAGDVGATFELARTFDSGIRVGAFATVTDVSAEDFGEGSFDKGFFLTIPLDLFTTESTRNASGFLFRPLSRDGGQRLDRGKALYPIVKSGDFETFERGWGQFLD